MPAEYKEDLSIDMFDLEGAWVRQSSTFMKYATLYANAYREKDKLRERLDVTKAELDAHIRTTPEEFGVSKLTESAVANAIVIQPEYLNAVKAYNDSVEQMHILVGAKTAMEHKKTALENLTKLHLQGYYSEPKIPIEAKETAKKERKKEEHKELNNNQRLKLRRRNLKGDK